MQDYHFANLAFTDADGRLRNDRAGLEASLRPQAARLLGYLLDHAGEVVPRERLIEAIWGEDAVVDFESGLAALLRELRQAIRSVDGPGDAVETVPRRGYRLNADVREGGAEGMHRWHPAIIFAALLPVLVVAGYGVWMARDGGSAAEPPELGLAILPFEDFERHASLPEHVGLLLADTLLAELLVRPVEGLQLLGRTSLRPYVDRQDVVSAVAEDLGVELLIEGAVVGRSDGGWRIEVRLLALPSGRVVWSDGEQAGAEKTLDVHAVAAAVAEALVRDWQEIRGRLSEGAAAG